MSASFSHPVSVPNPYYLVQIYFGNVNAEYKQRLELQM